VRLEPPHPGIRMSGDADALSDEKVASRPTNRGKKRSRHEHDCGVPHDLTIVLDDGDSVAVHKALLMMSSPVFRSMLTNGMLETTRDTISLPGKTAAELRCFIDSLALCTLHKLKNDSAKMLIPLAEEYQVLSLKRQCEEHIVANMPVSVEELTFALQYNLTRRVTQCVDHMAADVDKYIDDLQVLTESAHNAEVMCRFWPTLCDRAGLCKHDMPDMEAVRKMWPFLRKAVLSNPKDVLWYRLTEDMRLWPEQLRSHVATLQTGHSGKMFCLKMKKWMVDNLHKHGIESG